MEEKQVKKFHKLFWENRDTLVKWDTFEKEFRKSLKEQKKEVIEECTREIEKNELCLYSGDVKSIKNLLNKLK